MNIIRIANSELRSAWRATRVLVGCAALACLLAPQGFARSLQNEVPGHPMPGFTRVVGPLKVNVGPTRILAREARTALVHHWNDGTFVLTAGNSMVSTNLRSDDGLGQRWKRQQQYAAYVNSVQRAATGDLFILDYDLRAVSGQPGNYQVTLLSSSDQGRSIQSAGQGLVSLPTAIFDVNSLHWANDLIELSDGTLLAVVQSLSNPTSTDFPWFTSLIRSSDGGATWSFVSVVADQSTILDPNGDLTKDGWPLYWALEPTLLALSDTDLVCVMRSVNDEAQNMPLSLIGTEMSDYSDLGNTVRGSEIAPGIIAGIDSTKYYSLGPPNAPLVIARSSDGGATWSVPVPMAGPRGVFPRLASDGAGVLALTFGGLSGVPRHGNAISFSVDGGLTWFGELNLGPFLTTGYTQLVAMGPGRFAVFFDATPPQPWTEDEHWWVGAVDVLVEPAVIGPPYTVAPLLR